MNLDHLAQLATEATSGPWDWTAGMMAEGSERTWAGYPQRIMARNPDPSDTSPVLIAELYEGHEDEPPPNTAFIAAASPSVVLALVEVARAAQKLADRHGSYHPNFWARERNCPECEFGHAAFIALAKLDNLGGEES